MKLYSRTQVIVFSAVCVVLVFVVAGLAGFLTLPNAKGDGGSTVQNTLPALEPTFTQMHDSAAGPDMGYYSSDETQNIDIYSRLNEAVVNVTSISLSYSWFFDPVEQEGAGSGSIIDQEGRVLTNYHVIKGAEKLLVTLADGSEYEGDVVGIDPENDLAIIRFDPGGRRLTTIPFGSSEELRVGQKVLAIGNPFALERTLTTGIVSGLGRPVKTDGGWVIKETIQTDASINPGNSGGPLLNSLGEMIGINTAILSPSGGSVGVGFAVPVDTARRIIPDLLEFGEVRRGWIDIVPVQLYPQLVSYARLAVEQGILVSEVFPGGGADAAGIQGGNRTQGIRARGSVIYLGGDIIVEVDGLPITGIVDLYGALENNKPGETVEVVLLRGKTRKSVSVVLSERQPQR